MIAVYFWVMAPHFMWQRGIWVSSLYKEINPIPLTWHSELPGPGNMAQTNTRASPASLVSGGKQAASDGTLPCFSLLPSPTATRHRGEGVKKRKKWATERGDWEREEHQGGKERDSTRWIMQSCQRQLLLEVLAALKGSSTDLQQLPSHCSLWLRAAWSVLRQMVNKMRWRVAVAVVVAAAVWGEVSRWQVNCLRGTYRQRQARSLLQLFTEVTDREIWADLHRNPSGNIITKQKNREDLPFQHSAPWWLLHLHKMLLVLKSEVCMPAHFEASLFILW